MTCRPYKKSGKWGGAGDLHVDLDPLNDKGEVPNVAIGQPQKGKKTQFGPLRVGTDLRDHARILFVDHRRNLTQHLPSVRGSYRTGFCKALGKILQHKRILRSPMNRPWTCYAQNRLDRSKKQSPRRQNVCLDFWLELTQHPSRLGLVLCTPNPFNSLRLQFQDSGLTIPGEELGLGIQSAMVVGVFEAFRKLGGAFGTIVLEEPEMYLHPQAQRYFYRLLCEMSEKGQCQVIYSTHSPIFADVNRFECLRLVRRESGELSCVTFASQTERRGLKYEDAFKLGGRFDTARNEVLFANRALLLEGYGDRIAALIVAEKLEFDVDAEGIAIVDCGGKAGIELVIRVCDALGIPFVVVHDEDIWPVEDISDDEKRKKQEKDNKDNSRRIKESRTPLGPRVPCSFCARVLRQL